MTGLTSRMLRFGDQVQELIESDQPFEASHWLTRLHLGIKTGNLSWNYYAFGPSDGDAPKFIYQPMNVLLQEWGGCLPRDRLL